MSVVQEVETSPRARPVAHYDAVVVGAGPYGLSTAAHLLGRGLHIAVFGKTVESWRNHMPTGMLLRSHWWATNLSDPRHRYGFERFFQDSGRYDKCYPVPRDAFIEYACWFQERAVPGVDETYVALIERDVDEFLVTLEDGRSIRSAAVIMATGFPPYADRPEPYGRLPPALVSHSCEHRDCSRFRGATIVVIGGGQSAVEYAALLHEAGAAVHIVSRRPIRWLPPDRANARSMLERILAPTASIAPGWQNWVLDHQPYVLYRLPQPRKDLYNRNHYASAAADWLRDRVIGKIRLHEGHTIVTMEPVGGRVDVAISDGERVRADHIILATGYKVDLHKLTMLHPSLLAEIDADAGTPTLSRWFESSVPGLYFVGLTAVRAFGPLYRFVAGCEATAPRVATAVAHRLAAGSPQAT